MKTVKINPATVPNPPPGTSTFGINLLDYRKWLLAEEINSARSRQEAHHSKPAVPTHAQTETREGADPL
jgi:hypothetical protein